MRRALLALLLLTACTSNGGPSARSADPSQASSASPSAALPVVQQADAIYRGGFRTPTGNIACDLADGEVTCSMKVAPWKDLPPEGSCGTAGHRTVAVIDGGPAKLRGQCAFETDDRHGGPVLAYGTGVQIGQTQCVSQPDGLTCVDLGTDRGMFLSKSRYALTAPPPTVTVVPQPRNPVVVLPAYIRTGFVTAEPLYANCDLSNDEVHCLAGGRWDPPPYVGECDADLSSEIIVTGTEPGRSFTDCRSDSLSGGQRIVPGQGIRVGQMECLRTKLDLTCTNHANGHGFMFSHERFRGF